MYNLDGEFKANPKAVKSGRLKPSKIKRKTKGGVKEPSDQGSVSTAMQIL